MTFLMTNMNKKTVLELDLRTMEDDDDLNSFIYSHMCYNEDTPDPLNYSLRVMGWEIVGCMNPSTIYVEVEWI